MNMIRLANLFFCLILCVTQTVAQKVVTYEFDDFKKNDSLRGERIDVDLLWDPGQMEIVDSFLLIRNYNTSRFYQVININSGETVCEYGIKGRGPGELISPFGYQIFEAEDRIYINDPTKKAVQIYSLQKVLSNDSSSFQKSINIDVSYVKICITNEYMIGMLTGHRDNYSHCVISMKGEVIKYFGKYPNLPVKYNTLMACNLFQKPLGCVSADQRYYIEAYYDMNRIDIYDEFKLKTIIEGKKNNFLKYIIKGDGPILTDENYYCFEKISCNNKKIYAGYCGNIQRNNVPQIKDILVFNLEGDCLKRYSLDIPVNNFIINFENKTIWGINKVLEPTLYKFQY